MTAPQIVPFKSEPAKALKCGHAGEFRKGRRVCRLCENVRAAARRKKNPEVSRKASLRWYWNNLQRVNEVRAKRMFGLSPAEYRRLQTEYTVCGICGKPSQQKLCIDHNHETGKVRGLLCHACNLILGNAREDPTTLLKAIQYLERFKS